MLRSTKPRRRIASCAAVLNAHVFNKAAHEAFRRLGFVARSMRYARR